MRRLLGRSSCDLVCSLLARERFLVGLHICLKSAVQAEQARGLRLRVLAHLPAPLVGMGEHGDCPVESRGVARRNEKSGAAVVDQLCYATDVGGDDRDTEGHCFDDGSGETFRPIRRRQDEYVEGCEERWRCDVFLQLAHGPGCIVTACRSTESFRVVLM